MKKNKEEKFQLFSRMIRIKLLILMSPSSGLRAALD